MEGEEKGREVGEERAKVEADEEEEEVAGGKDEVEDRTEAGVIERVKVGEEDTACGKI